MENSVTPLKESLKEFRKKATQIPRRIVASTALSVLLAACGNAPEQTPPPLTPVGQNQPLPNPEIHKSDFIAEILNNDVRQKIFDIVPADPSSFQSLDTDRFLYTPAPVTINTEALQSAYRGISQLADRRASVSINNETDVYTLELQNLPIVLSIVSSEMNYPFQSNQTKAQTRFEKVGEVKYASSVVELTNLKNPNSNIRNYVSILTEICQATMKTVNKDGKYFTEYPPESPEYVKGKLAQETVCNGLSLAFLYRLAQYNYQDYVDPKQIPKTFDAISNNGVYKVGVWTPDEALYNQLDRYSLFPVVQE